MQAKQQATDHHVLAWLYYLIENLSEDKKFTLFRLMVREKISNILLKAAIDMTDEQRMDLLEKLKGMTSKNDFVERRRQPRKDCLIYVNISANGFSFKNFILDINQNGAFIETNESSSVGKIIKMSFQAPDSGNPMTVAATVIRADKQGIGIQFNDLTKEQQSSMRSFSENKKTIYEIKS
jgi:Tfp pilus assembly protein PilZ